MDRMIRVTNPFFFETPSDRWAFTNRDELRLVLEKLLSQQGRRLLVHGRRRMGKTSLLQNMAVKSNATLLYVDVSTSADLAQVAKKILDSAPEEEASVFKRVVDLAKKHFKSVEVSAGKITLGGTFRSEDGQQTLEHVLEYLNARAAIVDTPWTVCLDEFQDIRKLGGERIDWNVRGIIQSHRHLNYIFSGSDHRLVEWMTEPSAAFFKQLEQMSVGPIDPGHLALWIEKRAKTGGLPDFQFGHEIVAMAGPCTGDIVRLAKTTFDLVARGRKGQVVPSALDSISTVELAGEHAEYWSKCTVARRAMLQVIAAGKATTAATTLREFGLKSASTAQSAVERLLEMQLLIRENGQVIFDSPFFKRWVALNAI